jgi:CheY-like chemotaxis protein
MGGEIVVESQFGRGSHFTASLNLPKVEALSSQKILPMHELRKMSNPELSNSKKILVVEDYAPNMMVVTLMLESLGYEVVPAESGEKALEYLSMQDVPPAAILMDVQMHGMDGYETTRQIRDLEKAKGFQNFIIGVTAHALAGDREHCIAEGMDDYMSKPVHPDILAAKLEKLTGHLPSGAAA